MTTNPSIDDVVKRHYPNAIRRTVFMERLRTFLGVENNFEVSKLLLATSLCADDIIALREEEKPHTKAKMFREFLGPFSMGGLAGLPYSGLTGMSAISHHIPDGGSLVIGYGPHIGISDAGELGKLTRPGQTHESSACGALVQAVEHFKSGPDYCPRYDEDDSEQMILERRLLPYREQILQAESPIKAATDCAFAIIHDLVHRYVQARMKEFNCKQIALAGGVMINTSYWHEDYNDLRHLSVIQVPSP